MGNDPKVGSTGQHRIIGKDLSSMNKSILFATSALVAFTGMGIAAAQDTDDVIIVTAGKREQTLQEVPIAVSVVDDEVVADAQINDLLDLQSVVPSLRVSQLERANNATFIIRGFGNGGNNPGIEPSVSVYIDGVFRSRSASAISDFLDLERVEVLRGPQSTLFGKNATAGVVSFVTKKPSFDWNGVAEVTYGNYDQRIARGYVTGPITDNLAFSLSGSVNKRDGYTDNLAGGPSLNDRDRWSIRGQALWQPTDSLELRLIADMDEIDEVCCAVLNAAEEPFNFVEGGPTPSEIVRALGGNKNLPGAFEFEVAQDVAPIYEISNDGISLQADWNLTDNIDFTSITSFRTKDEFSSFEGDFTTLEILNPVIRTLDTETFTQEIRFTGETDRFSWLVGGFYFDETADVGYDITYGADTRAFVDYVATDLAGDVPLVDPSPLLTIEFLQGEDFNSYFSEGRGTQGSIVQDNQQFSIFAQTDINITDRLVLTLGVSYFDDEKEVSIATARNNTFTDIDLLNFAGGVGLPLQPVQVLDSVTDFPNSVEGNSTSDSDYPYTIRAAYDVTDRTNVYISYATGFKASSWALNENSRPFAADLAALGAANLLNENTAFAQTAIDPDSYAGTRFAGPEDTTSIEIGLKTSWDWGSLNFAAFDQTIEGFQSQIFQGTGFILTNAGEQSVRGFEFDTNIQPFEGLTLTWAGTYLDAEYDEFLIGNGPPNADNLNGTIVDLSGTEPAGIPEFSSSFGVDYRRDYSFGEAFIRADYQYESDVQVIDNVPADVASREVNQVNASVGVNMENGFEALLWSRNLFNDEHFTSAFPTTLQFGGFSTYPNPPRTYGVTVRKRF